jgi:3-oxoacyl-[acyl-carrier-protein] synthase III
MGTIIRKIDYFLPSQVVTNDQLSEEFPEWQSLKIEEKLGIRERHIVKSDETALDLAYEAANKVLIDYDKTQIDFLILCTQSPDYFLPTSACVLQEKLGLKNSIGAFDFNLGCSGFIYGLAISKGLINSGISRKLLFITSETYTKHINKLDKGNRTIFGDGAAATILEYSEHENIHLFDLGTDGKGMNDLIIPNGGLRNKYSIKELDTVDEMGNFRNNNFLYMNGPQIFNFTIEKIPALIKNVLVKNKITVENVDYFIFHQANKYLLDYLRKKLKIDESKFYNNILNTGNTVSSTIPIALKNCMDNNILKKGYNVLLCGFGVGYSWGGVIIEI